MDESKGPFSATDAPDRPDIPGLFGGSEPTAFTEFCNAEHKRQAKEHGRYAGIYMDSSALYRAWSAGRLYEMRRGQEAVV